MNLNCSQHTDLVKQQVSMLTVCWTQRVHASCSCLEQPMTAVHTVANAKVQAAHVSCATSQFNGFERSK